MAATDVKKVLQLKLQLKENAEGQTLLKTLKKLQELDITLDILAETGIGKVVNSFRKHGDAGEVAKTLVHQWKKLVPKEQSSVAQPQPSSPKKLSKSELRQTGKEDNQASDTSNSSEKKSKNGSAAPYCKPMKISDSNSKGKLVLNKSKMVNNSEIKDSDLHVSSVDKKSMKPKEEPSTDCSAKQKDKDKHQKQDKNSCKHRPKMSVKTVKSSLYKELVERHCEKKRDSCKNGDNKEKKKRVKITEHEKEPQEEEPPSMSFEAYLSYDLETPKRKKRPCNNEKSKRFKADLKPDVGDCDTAAKSSKSLTKTPTSLVSKLSVLDLLKVPLPTISPDCEDLSQYQYFTEKKVEEKAVSICEEAPVFTGQRLNKKMQVYSGSKVTYLPSMMTLYQQCIRTVQNNLDSLYEVGGVPFEILEPVLERCTPEQLLRIEECNPVYIGVTDHLWERHCHRDFRNTQLEEYESWREMYVRLSEERERKLQQLTKSIVSAHSGKPRGRQVKMAFIHSAAKPPRNVRIQQELHGTAGLPHPTDKASARNHESRGRSGFPEPTKSTISGSSQAQDSKKIKRVAPMMAKSLKAFRNQLGRR